jgi:hypothetical protein
MSLIEALVVYYFLVNLERPNNRLPTFVHPFSAHGDPFNKGRVIVVVVVRVFAH